MIPGLCIRSCLADPWEPHSMLPPFDAMVFDFDGTLAVLNLDFGDMRQRVLELAAGHGLAPDTLREMYILEMIDSATALLRRQHANHAEAFYRDAHQLLQDIEVEAAQSSRLLPGVPEL